MTQTADMEVYFSTFCPFCRWAKALLDRKQIEYTLYNIDQDPSRRREMTQRSQRTSVPQIFIDQQPIGGFDELSTLDRSGQLDQLLTGTTPH